MRRYTALFLISAVFGASTATAAPSLPGVLPLFDDLQFPTVEDKSQQFVDYLYRTIERENTRVLNHRVQLEEFSKKINESRTLSDNNLRAFERLAGIYRVTLTDDLVEAVSELEPLILPVPPSLILSHALAEGLWNPHFSESSINLFRIPCLPDECPESSLQDPVPKSYRSINSLISDYIWNINTNPNLNSFREKRQADYRDGLTLDGRRFLDFWEPLMSSETTLESMAEAIEKFDLSKYDSWH